MTTTLHPVFINLPRLYSGFACGNQDSLVLLPPATKLGQGNFLTGVCDSVNGGCFFLGGCLLWGVSALGGVSAPGGCLLPWGVSARGVSAPWGAWWSPPRDGYCCWRYASYWNAFLLTKIFSVVIFHLCLWSMTWP